VVEAGQHRDDAGQVGTLLARRLSTAEVEVLDQPGIQTGNLGKGRGHHGNRQVIRADVLQRAFEGSADGAAGGGDDDGFGHGSSLHSV